MTFGAAMRAIFSYVRSPLCAARCVIGIAALAGGGTLLEILLAGEWRSPAFLEYLSKEEVANAVADDPHIMTNVLGESSDDGD